MQARREDPKGFPTPPSLMAAQRQYSKSKKPPRKNNGEVAPEPFPPPTLKAQIYNVADYADVDSHARKVHLHHIIIFQLLLTRCYVETDRR